MAGFKTQRFLTLKETADALAVSKKTVRRRIEDGSLHAHRIGRQLRISEEDYRTYAARSRE